MTSQATPIEQAVGSGNPRSSIYRSGTLWLLMIISTLNFLDRQVLNILAEPIKNDLGLSDTEIGLLTGLAFALFYTVLGIPIARYADRSTTNRSSLIAICLVFWSGMTALCGMAQSYGQLLLARIGVGVGEAGCTPAAHSLISDLYPKEQRASALAFYGLGLPIGTLLGLGLGGGLAELFGWRITLISLGLPGIVIGLLSYLAIRDPRKHGRLPPVTTPQPSMKDVLSEILGSRAFLYLVAAMALGSFLSYGKNVWQAIFFMRSHGLTPGVAGPVLGLVVGIGAAFGAWLGGWLATHYGTRNPRHILTGPALGGLLAMPLSLGAYYTGDWRLAAVLLTLATISSGLAYGPTFTCVQGLVRPQSRGVATAIFLFVMNLIGLGLGPLFFGVLSDALRPIAGVESVRWVLYIAVTLAPIPAFMFWRSSLYLSREMKN
ncbi:spinster family MFS transporter [Sphingopyxis terrae]|uniref:spinster family MFS transporter n=1 Tax=Sphingopyxis terrae TaxID=33052 RepID=UPI003F7D361E